MRKYVFHVGQVLLGCVLLSAVPSAAAQERLTPGAVALLVNQKTPESLAVLRQAVTDPDVNVRRVAARAAGVGNRGDLAPVLLQQLEREQDDRAGAEELRAVLFIRGPQALEQARAGALRLGGMARLAFAEWLARKDPARFGNALPELAEGQTSEYLSNLAAIAAMAIRQHPDARERVSEVWAREATGAGWRTFLDTLGATALDDSAPLRTGLMAANPDVREHTRWFAISQAAYGRKLPLTRLPSEDAQAASGESEWARAGRELLARIVEHSKPSDVSQTIGRALSERRGDDVERLMALGDILTSEERAALPGEQRGRFDGGFFTSLGQPAAARTFQSVTPGMLANLLSALGCTAGTSDELSGVARVRYNADGRVQKAEIDAAALAKECAAAVEVLSRLTLAAPDEFIRADEWQVLLLPINAAAIACVDSPDPPLQDWSTRSRRPMAVTKPTKIRDVPPIYPESAQKARIQGVIVIEALVSATGCVKGSKVVRSIPALDLAALRAVSGWGFTPTLRDGTPVRVNMTVTVNFSLR